MKKRLLEVYLIVILVLFVLSSLFALALPPPPNVPDITADQNLPQNVGTDSDDDSDDIPTTQQNQSVITADQATPTTTTDLTPLPTLPEEVIVEEEEVSFDDFEDFEEFAPEPSTSSWPLFIGLLVVIALGGLIVFLYIQKRDKDEKKRIKPLKEYLMKCKACGFSEEKIRTAAKMQGWNVRDLNTAFGHASSKLSASPQKKPGAPPQLTKSVKALPKRQMQPKPVAQQKSSRLQKKK